VLVDGTELRSGRLLAAELEVVTAIGMMGDGR